MGLPPLEDDCEPNSAAGISPLGGKTFAGTVDGISPTRKQQHKLSKPLYIHSTTPEVEIGTPKRLGHTNFKDQW